MAATRAGDGFGPPLRGGAGQAGRTRNPLRGLGFHARTAPANPSARDGGRPPRPLGGPQTPPPAPRHARGRGVPWPALPARAPSASDDLPACTIPVARLNSAVLIQPFGRGFAAVGPHRA